MTLGDDIDRKHQKIIDEAKIKLDKAIDEYTWEVVHATSNWRKEKMQRDGGMG
jgi:hypothetical protein